MTEHHQDPPPGKTVLEEYALPELLDQTPPDQTTITPATLQDLRDRFHHLWSEAERIHALNEKAFQGIRDIRHRMIGARTTADLIATIIQDLSHLQVDQVQIILVTEVIGPQSRSMANLDPAWRQGLTFMNRTALHRLYADLGGLTPHIGPRTTEDLAELFGPEIASRVLLPLEYRQELLGSLNLGAKSVERFAADRATDLLEDLAVTAALCLDNVLTHEHNEELATTDPLTGVHNRRSFLAHAQRALDLANRYGDSVSCLFIDVNKFKPINDRYGHEVGDLALKKLALCLAERIRRTDILARVGGDEFAVLLPRVSPEQARRLALELREGVRQISLAADGYPDLTLSAAMGVVTARPTECSIEELIRRADAAMYEEKGKRGQKQTA